MTSKSRGHTGRRIAVRLATLAVTSASLTGGALTVSSWGPAGAAETHQDCVSVDDSGVIMSVVPSCSQTITTKGGDPQVAPDSANPCSGALGTFTMIPGNSIFHVNTNKDGDIWVTGTDNGTATFVPNDPAADPSGSGHWTSWFGLNFNNRNSNHTSTFDVVMHLSDGGLVTQHEVAHYGLSATGLTVTFDKMGGVCR